MKMKCIFPSLIILLISFSLSAQKHSLKLDLRENETYYHDMYSSSKVTQEINSQQLDITTSITCKAAFKILNRIDSLYDIAVSYESLSLSMKLPTSEISFSSEKKDNSDILSTIFSALLGKPFLIKMTSTGKITEVKNADSIIESVFATFTQVPAEQRQQLTKQLIQAYGAKSFKGNFEMITNIYPDMPVTIGDHWKINTKLETAMAADLTTTFEFKDRNDSAISLIGIGQFDTLDKDAYMPVNGMPTRYSLSGSMLSEIELDPKTGWIKKAKVTQKTSGSAEIKDNPSLPGGITIPMSFENKMTYKSN